MSNGTRQSNKVVTGLVIGSVIGVTISLIDPATRKRTIQRVEHLKDTSTRFVQSYKENPDEFKKNCKERMNLSAEAMKDIAAETQGLYKQIQSTVKERSKDLKEITDDFKQLYFQSMHQYKRITKKIITTKDQVIESSNQEEKSQLPATSEDKEVMKTDTVLQ